MKNGKRSTVILIAVFAVGLSLLLYPTVSDWWNSFHQSRAISSYVEAVADIDDASYDELLAQAQAYNEALAQTGINWTPTDEELAVYNGLLSVESGGIMGYIEIPAIDVHLPIYHGTSNAVLQTGVGHIEGSSLPVGGPSTHTIVSGHRGLPSAKLFTDLDQLQVGDLFMLYVLDEMLTYEVDQILIVEPEDVSALEIIPGRDLCTLVTCTPYGINTHRLLVRGTRIENEPQAQTVRVTSDAVQVEPLLVAPVLAAPVLLILLLVLLLPGKQKRKKEED